MKGENRLLARLQMNRLRLRNNWFQFKTSRKQLDIREIYRVCLKLVKKNQKISTRKHLGLETLGSRPNKSKNLPGRCCVSK